MTSLIERAQDEDQRVPLRRIFVLFRPYRWALAGLLALIVVQAGLGVASPFFLRAILDDALPRRDTGLLSLLAAGMIVSALGSGAISALGSGAMSVGTTGVANTIGQRVMNDLRVAVYGHLQRTSLAFFTRTRTGEVLSRVFNDVGWVDNVVNTTASSIRRTASRRWPSRWPCSSWTGSWRYSG